MNRNWIFVVLILILAILGGLFAVPWSLAQKTGIQVPDFLQKPFKLGLDLQGGVHLLYQADLSKIAKEDWQDSMEGLRDVIERRVNLFGIQEPIVQVQKTVEGYRLIAELAGVIDPDEAIKMIGKTPYLEFREEMSEEEKMKIINMLPEEEINIIIARVKEETGQDITKEEVSQYIPLYSPTELTGKYLKGAKIEFDQTTYKPQIGLEFNSEGAKIFAKLTEKNVGKQLAIYIDNQLISAPVVQEKISGGKAQITGQFTIEEARTLAQNLNAGALPVPIELISQQSIGPSLGKMSIEKSLFAGIIGFLLMVLFMILVYRFSGFLAVISLSIYTIILLSLFKLMPVTLTLSGIAGFILSLGMAVDANILIFERFREERKQRENFDFAVNNAFSRAWTAIRDGNLTTLLICTILFLVASGFVQGFALTLGVGVLCSMFTAMVITKLFIKTLGETRLRKFGKIWSR